MEKKAKGRSLNLVSDYYDFLTPAERSRFRRNQIDLVNLKEGENVLDVGCGTGVLSILAKIAVGETGEVQGVDLAPRMISKAQTKSEKINLKIDFVTASIDELPYTDEFFDVVISSMMYHHLPVEIKRKGLEEVYRVLKCGGRFFISDFCAPHYLTLPLMYLMFIWVPSTRYQLFGKLPGLIGNSQFGPENIKMIKKGLFLEYYLITKGEAIT